MRCATGRERGRRRSTIVRKTVYDWLGREFVALGAEGPGGNAPAEQLKSVVARFAQELGRFGLGLENVTRTRLWARDRQSRDEASAERARLLSGKARSASSSYIAPEHFASAAEVALELVAMRPARAGSEKILKEYEPPITPLRYLLYDSVVFLSGVTAVVPGLDRQLAEIVPRIGESLADAGASWHHVVEVCCFLHRGEEPADLRRLFQALVKAPVPRFEIGFVDGFSSPGKLVEIEVTAKLEP